MKLLMTLLVLFTCNCLAGDLTTLDGATYRNIKVTRVEADGLVITHAEGAGKIEFLNLPEDVRKEYGYDPAKAEAVKKAAAAGWQEMDQRLVFFTIQLSSVEASLAAINHALLLLGSQQAVHQYDATIARHANEAMDRNAGGPVPWADFYGRTAEKFFYHPTDRHTRYHTLTILGQTPASGDVAPAQGVPSRQGLPVHQRPPQFDYIYRANSEAEQRAQEEVARLGNNVAALVERRRQLEAEQSALWCKIGFHALAVSCSRNRCTSMTSKAPGRTPPKVDSHWKRCGRRWIFCATATSSPRWSSKAWTPTPRAASASFRRAWMQRGASCNGGS